MKKRPSKSSKRAKRLELNRKLFRILKFLVLFNLFSIPLYALIYLDVSIYPLQKFTADAVTAMLKLVGTNSFSDGLLVSIPLASGYFSGAINWDCTGWKSILAFAALVFATEESLRKKLLSMVFVPLIFLINIFRVSAVFFLVSVYGTQHFALIHTFFFGFFMIAAVLVLWVIWLRYFKFPAKKK